MYIDLIMSDGNESEFVDMAEKLGYSRLCFVYDSSSLKTKKADASWVTGIKKKYSNAKIKVYAGVSCGPKEVQRYSTWFDLTLCKSSEDNRAVLERFRPDIIYDLEYHGKSDFLHNKNSGINHIMAKIAAKNGVGIGTSLSKFICSSKQDRVKITPRIKQNIVLCRKTKARFLVFSAASSPYMMRAPGEVISFLGTLGMIPTEAKESMKLSL